MLSQNQKPNQILLYNLLKGATVHFYCLFDEWSFMEGIELKIDCVNIWKCSETAKLLLQIILVLNWIKQFSPVSIVSFSIILNQMEMTSEYF